ncbi:uncharacterized protein BJ171DRAFT_214451 [Polychytrium aggregatum]|uniref:uncharacterized protein n=1 Tax=Polychytrium aggregatum TaxID=110093 RepID=UPI0022FF2258|nr:uncharacterized protein BJ171DRAFT_214451 [Polychytrium aggregatum]KAI9199469.1 hypothetical protein BJ171DRAFT_214451 [Polychytrium aggregatum]
MGCSRSYFVQPRMRAHSRKAVSADPSSVCSSLTHVSPKTKAIPNTIPARTYPTNRSPSPVSLGILKAHADFATFVLFRIAYTPTVRPARSRSEIVSLPHLDQFQQFSRTLFNMLAQYPKLRPLFSLAYFYAAQFCKMTRLQHQQSLAQRPPSRNSTSASISGSISPSPSLPGSDSQTSLCPSSNSQDELEILPNQLLSIFRIALILAQKFHNDQRYSNDSWSRIFDMPLPVLNEMERKFLAAIQYTLHIRPSTYDSWLVVIHELRQEYHTRILHRDSADSRAPLPISTSPRTSCIAGDAE